MASTSNGAAGTVGLIIMGNSFGGAITQILFDRGLGPHPRLTAQACLAPAESARHAPRHQEGGNRCSTTARPHHRSPRGRRQADRRPRARRLSGSAGRGVPSGACGQTTTPSCPATRLCLAPSLDQILSSTPI